VFPIQWKYHFRTQLGNVRKHSVGTNWTKQCFVATTYDACHFFLWKLTVHGQLVCTVCRYAIVTGDDAATSILWFALNATAGRDDTTDCIFDPRTLAMQNHL
jgi:hypothetical protein